MSALREDDPRHELVICGSRETRTTGTYECVMPPDHSNQAHYYVRLTTRPQESA